MFTQPALVLSTPLRFRCGETEIVDCWLNICQDVCTIYLQHGTDGNAWCGNVWCWNVRCRNAQCGNARCGNNLQVVNARWESRKVRVTGARVFRLNAPKTLNSLPDNVRLADSFEIFRSHLKTHFYVLIILVVPCFWAHEWLCYTRRLKINVLILLVWWTFLLSGWNFKAWSLSYSRDKLVFSLLFIPCYFPISRNL